ncbi:MAG: hypothetical protein ACRECO_16160 [Xanthobacteraceae bacterium]
METRYHVGRGRIDAMGRYLIILGIAILVVVLFWPYLRQLDPTRQRAEAAAGARKGGQIFFALAVCVGLSLAISALLYLLAL